MCVSNKIHRSIPSKTAAAVSGLLFGLDTGIISGALVEMDDAFDKPLTDTYKELITSATTLGVSSPVLLSPAISD